MSSAASQRWAVCLPPNRRLREAYADPGYLLALLRRYRCLHAAALRHSGHPHKIAYDEFYRRYVLLVSARDLALASGSVAGSGGGEAGGLALTARVPGSFGSQSPRTMCRRLLAVLLQHPAFEGVDPRTSALYGATRLFLRRHVYEALETMRQARLMAMDALARRVQSGWRGHRARRSLRQIMKGTRRAQAMWRCLLLRSLWERRRWCASVI